MSDHIAREPLVRSDGQSPARLRLTSVAAIPVNQITFGEQVQAQATEADMSMAKLKATEVLAMVADEAIQIHGGMGLMDELPLERIWRDARVERIWEGTSEIQRHIISRDLLRPLGG